MSSSADHLNQMQPAQKKRKVEDSPDSEISLPRSASSSSSSASKIVIVCQPGLDRLARQIMDDLKTSFPEHEFVLVEPKWGQYPNGAPDIAMRKTDLPKAHRVFYVGCLSPPEVLQTIATLSTISRESSPGRLHALFTYLPHARDDTPMNPDDPFDERILTLPLVLDLLKAPVERLILMDPHNQYITMMGKQGKIESCGVLKHLILSAYPPDRSEAVGRKKTLLVVFPDTGAHKRFKYVISQIESESDAFAKVIVVTCGKDRSSPTDVHVTVSEVPEGDRDAIKAASDSGELCAAIVDDIYGTGGTINQAADKVTQALGLKKIDAITTHFEFTGDAVKKLRAGPIGQIYVSDSTGPEKAELARKHGINVFSVGRAASSYLDKMIRMGL